MLICELICFWGVGAVSLKAYKFGIKQEREHAAKLSRLLDLACASIRPRESGETRFPARSRDVERHEETSSRCQGFQKGLPEVDESGGDVALGRFPCDGAILGITLQTREPEFGQKHPVLCGSPVQAH